MILRLLIRRLLLAVPLVLAVVTLTFFMVRLAPGDPAVILAGESPSPAFLAQVRAEYGLDQPLWWQFVAYLRKAATGDFGTSIYFRRPVFAVIWERFPATALLTGSAMVVASFAGIGLGVAAARRAGTRADTAISAATLVGYSVPGFWIGQLLVMFFAVQLDWLPASGMTAARASHTGLAHVADVAAHLVLPMTTLAVFLLTMIARFTRAAMVDALGQDFVLVARAKGAGVGRVIWHHAFRNAVVTEIVFGWPGLGRVFYDAINRRDFPLLTGSFIFSAVIVIAVNTISDVACALLDPRIRRR